MGSTRTIYISSEKDLQLYNQAKKIADQKNQTLSRYLLDALKEKVVREGGNEETHSSLEDIGLIKKLNVFFDKQKSQTDLQLHENFISPREYILEVTNKDGIIVKKVFKGFLIAVETNESQLTEQQQQIMVFQTLKNNIVVYERLINVESQTTLNNLNVYNRHQDIPSLSEELDRKIQALLSIVAVESLDI